MKAPKVSAPPLVDARGKPCPLPIIALAKALKIHAEVVLWADDPAVRADLVSFCAATGATLGDLETDGAVIKARVAR